jgi:pimeloyl-ACP methyl ester carboxylesterase
MSYGSSDATPLHFRNYGEHGPLAFVLHGGPGAPGYMAPVARGIASFARAIEPFQRRSGDEPLTVRTHILDLHHLMSTEADAAASVIIGHSWGAMLALAYAAEYPATVSRLALIGCGTFDPASRERLQEIRTERMTSAVLERQARLLKRFPKPDDRLRAMGSLNQRIDSVRLVPHRDETAAFDARGHEETWGDMLRLQAENLYPAAFASIRAPVLMIHGEDDPHPGPMIRDCLAPHLPNLEYRELARCGHYPWLELDAADEFQALLRNWLLIQTPAEA